MSGSLKDTAKESAPDIRIERMNSDKTRKDSGSDTVYHIYFELSGHPAPEWTSIFGTEWQKVNPTQKAAIEGSFLVLHCQLDEVATTLLPLLKKAFAATNEAYNRFAQKEAADLEHREDAWKQERTEVDNISNSLRFD